MRVLVTGHMGFIGSHLAASYADHALTLVDVRDGGDVRDFFRADAARYDLVLHCAAVVGGRAMIDGSPLTLAAEDLSIDAELFRWAERTRPGRLVYFSSSAGYPTWMQDGDHRPLTESDISLGCLDSPDQTYGLVKLVGERLADEYRTAGGTVTVFRPFSGYGEDQDLDYPFPSIVRRAVERTSPFPIWSNTVRDFVHVDDVVGTVRAAVESGVDGPVNICTGRGTSFADLAQLCMAEVGYDAPVHVLDVHPGVTSRIGDPTALHEFYVPSITVEEGVRRACLA